MENKLAWAFSIFALIIFIWTVVSLTTSEPEPIIIGGLDENNDNISDIFFSDTPFPEPSILIRSNNTNTIQMEPLYFIELNMNKCRETICECASWGCLVYCFICDEDDVLEVEDE